MAIIGFGGMAGWHFKNAGKRVPGLQFTGAYDIREEAKADIIKKGMKLYESPEELYADGTVDLVLVATPNNFHKDYIIACLEAGKHVISEKPVTLNAAELEEIIAVSKRTGKFFTVHQNRRWDKDYLTIRKILNDKLLHSPYIIESRVQGSRQAMHGWRSYKINGGGMVLDWGVHLLDQMLDLFPNPVVSVNAHLHSVYSNEVDDNFVANLRFENGITALINVSMNSFIVQPRWHMSCQDGTAVIENWERDGKIVKLADESALEWSEEIVYTAAGPTRSRAPRPKYTTEELPLPKVEGDWIEYYKNIHEVLEGKAELIVKPEQTLRVMKVIDAIFASERAGASITTSI
jgi:predicted dehydrogenase